MVRPAEEYELTIGVLKQLRQSLIPLDGLLILLGQFLKLVNAEIFDTLGGDLGVCELELLLPEEADQGKDALLVLLRLTQVGLSFGLETGLELLTTRLLLAD